VPTVSAPRPLTPTDDRERFHCGRASLDNWFRRHALANQLGGASRVSVMTEAASGRIIGFVTLSAAQIERAFLSKRDQRHRPAAVPATLLGQLAVDLDFQGNGYASDLLLFALKTSLLASKSVASIGVITHPLDDALRGFYARRGFLELPFDPRRAMIARMAEIETCFETGAV
jgi:predicted N-acetyltransferase YhbS